MNSKEGKGDKMHQLRTKIIFLMFIIMILSAQLCLYAPEQYVAANIQMVDIVKVNSTKEKNTSNGGIRLTLKQLQKKFPHGKYWNHANNPGYENVYNAQDSYTSIPCKHKGTIGTDKQTCNGFQPEDLQLSWQCMGYAEKLGYDATGYNPRLDENGWYTDRRITALDRLKAGDIVRYCNNGHSIYVTGVDGENVTYTDCNTDGCCVIKWNQMTTKSVLKMSFSYVRVAPFEVKDRKSVV